MTIPQSIRTVTTLRSRKARVGLAAAALLTLSACGGIASDAPTDASVEDFCTSAGATEGTAEDVAKDLADVGTPDDISDDERNGFEVYVDALNDEGDTDVSEITLVEVPEDDKEDGEAFLTYLTETCSEFFAGELEVPSEEAS